ncbi:hypothetical protein HYR69_00635, partial [Candidatus Sumerlaeota bacterium]|nr:hypothetical protein [Candidatus Sumerlaeota bacterium]
VEPSDLPPTPTPNPPPASSPKKKETQIADAKPDPKPAAKPDPKLEPERGAPEKPKEVAVAEKSVDEKSYSEIDAARWDPKLSPMEPAAWKREQTRISIEKFFESMIEKPVFRGEFDAKRNALARTGGSTATTLLAKLDELSKTNTQVALSFQILDGGKYWSDRAEMRVEVKATGHPADSPDPGARKVLLKFSNPVPVRVQKVGDSWALLSFNNH